MTSRYLEDLPPCTKETSSLSTVRPGLVILVIIALVILYKYFTIVLEIKSLEWESEKIEGTENPTEFVTLGLSRVVTKASFTFKVKKLNVLARHSLIL